MAVVLIFLYGAFSFVTGGDTTGSEVSWELRHADWGSARDCSSSLTTKAAWKHSTQPFHLTTGTLVTLFTSSDNNDIWNQSTHHTVGTIMALSPRFGNFDKYCRYVQNFTNLPLRAVPWLIGAEPRRPRGREHPPCLRSKSSSRTQKIMRMRIPPTSD